MNIIVQPRQTGKTTELIKKSAETGYYIVCDTHAMAQYTFKIAQDLKLNIPLPITSKEFIEGRFSSFGIKGFLIDNAEFILSRLAKGVKIDTITMTG